jgi:hypothetical protein
MKCNRQWLQYKFQTGPEEKIECTWTWLLAAWAMSYKPYGMLLNHIAINVNNQYVINTIASSGKHNTLHTVPKICKLLWIWGLMVVTADHIDKSLGTQDPFTLDSLSSYSTSCWRTHVKCESTISVLSLETLVLQAWGNVWSFKNLVMHMFNNSPFPKKNLWN